MKTQKTFDIKNITTILFDNDGIFVDTEELYLKANRQILEPLGIKISKEKYINETLVSGEGFDSLLPESLAEKHGRKELRKKRNKIYLELLKTELVILPYVKEVLEKIKKSRKFKIGVVTSSQREMFKAIHAKTDFEKFFDFVVDRESVNKLKPYPQPYLKGLEIANSKDFQTIVVEDSERGLNAAYAANITCFCIPTELTQKQNFSKAFKVLKNFKVLEEILELGD